MNLAEARQQVIDMGLRLTESGLIARTWGNVSCRLDDNHFVITPSGRNYADLTPDEIVIVNISDGRSWGDIRPSSEKQVHLAGYRESPNTGFIIHTHQTDATVLSTMETDLSVEDVGVGILADKIPCARYGFPGTEDLRDAVSEAFQCGRYPAVLMAHHGAILMGKDNEDAFRMAVSLEMLSSFRIRKAFEAYIGRPIQMTDFLYDKVLEQNGFSMPRTARQFCRSERKGGGRIFYRPDGEEVELPLDSPSVYEEHRIHLEIYRKRPDIGAIHHSINPATVAYSVLGEKLPAYMDDFAQINGEEMDCAPIHPKALAEALGDHHGVFIRENGALCCGNTLYDADAHAMITEKNARAYFISHFFPDRKIYQLGEEDCKKMREFYLQSYSKRFDRE